MNEVFSSTNRTPNPTHKAILADEFIGRLNQDTDDFERAVPDRNGDSMRPEFALVELYLPLLGNIDPLWFWCRYACRIGLSHPQLRSALAAQRDQIDRTCVAFQSAGYGEP